MLTLNDVAIDDTFAEAFPMSGARIVITADTATWAETAAQEFAGNASSVIGCDAEAAIERAVSPEETPDGRTGISVLAFAFNAKGLAKAVASRVGQNVLTCPTTACYDGLPAELRTSHISVGGGLRYFGDGMQASKKLGPRRYWRIPVMDGEFVCEDRFGVCEGVGGGNLPSRSPGAFVPFRAESSAREAKSARGTPNSAQARTIPTVPRCGR
jgi:formylmethanofuran--tetrahydromethanopterin N-formyltransferase